ncbi:MAG: DUF2141 domain-containing protein [Bacteroidetes bacterium]|nr:DUF2141 domain-containing protein [Bacteroidota bacterium]
MNSKCILIILLSILFIPARSQSTKLNIVVSDIRNDNGKIAMSVFTGADGFPMGSEKALKKFTAPITNGKARFSLNFKPGEYALAFFHDENDNDELDANFIGIPKEGVCASNNAQSRMGPPKYEDARFMVSGGEKDMFVKMTYIGED